MEVVFRTAAQALEDERSRLKMTTGDGDLDALIGGIELGMSYLFYGNSQDALDRIIHSILVNSVLPVDEGGFGGKALYFNNCNYHQGKTILNPSLLGGIAKRAGLDPNVAFEGIYAICAFNEQQQSSAAKEMVDFLSRTNEVRLLVIHNLTMFLGTSRKPGEAYQALKEAIGALWRTAAQNKITIVANCEASGSSFRFMSKPQGGSFLRHEASVVVNLRRVERLRGIRACLVKHPYRMAPDSIILRVSEGGVNLMGRVTPSFRQLFESQVDELRRRFQNALLDLNHRGAFNLLLKQAWSAEGQAMANSGVPCVLDAMNLMANVENQRCVEELRRTLREFEGRLQKLEKHAEQSGEGRTNGENQ